MSTTYMNLTLPTASSTPGPTYATQNNAAFTVIDAHNHTSGSGVQLGSAALDIDADLPLNDFNLTLIRTSRYYNQSTSLTLGTDLNCIYVKDGELYYIDASGNQVQVTAAGSVNVAGTGNITGMGGTSATATYTSASSKFSFLSAALTPAVMQLGPLVLSTNAASQNTVTITPPNSLAASYTLTLPTGLPASTAFVNVDNTGALGTALYTTVGTTIGATGVDNIAATMTSTGANAIAATMTSTGANAIAATMTVTGANAIAADMTSTGANAIGLNMTTAAAGLTAGGKNVVVGTSTALRTIRGVIYGATLTYGEGCTVSGSVAAPVVTFTTPFSGVPSVVVSTLDSNRFSYVTNISASSAQFAASDGTEARWTFIAVGPV